MPTFKTTRIKKGTNFSVLKATLVYRAILTIFILSNIAILTWKKLYNSMVQDLGCRDFMEWRAVSGRPEFSLPWPRTVICWVRGQRLMLAADWWGGLEARRGSRGDRWYAVWGMLAQWRANVRGSWPTIVSASAVHLDGSILILVDTTDEIQEIRNATFFQQSAGPKMEQLRNY